MTYTGISGPPWGDLRLGEQELGQQKTSTADFFKRQGQRLIQTSKSLEIGIEFQFNIDTDNTFKR